MEPLGTVFLERQMCNREKREELPSLARPRLLPRPASIQLEVSLEEAVQLSLIIFAFTLAWEQLKRRTFQITHTSEAWSHTDIKCACSNKYHSQGLLAYIAVDVFDNLICSKRN